MERDLIHENAPPSSSSFSPFISNLRNSQIQQVLVQQWIRSCQKEEPLSGSLRLINMVAVCVWGQMSNRLICLEKHMLFAALLNRVLVIPSSKLDYKYNRVLDIDHINKCTQANNKVLISFQEFSSIKKRMHLLCYFSLPKPCYLDQEHLSKLKSFGMRMPGSPIRGPLKMFFQGTAHLCPYILSCMIVIIELAISLITGAFYVYSTTITIDCMVHSFVLTPEFVSIPMSNSSTIPNLNPD